MMDLDNSSASNDEGVQQPRRKNTPTTNNNEQARVDALKLDLPLISVATLESIFNKKNGTPRQSGICPQSKGIVRLHKTLFNNPMHALEGMEQFQYVWILYYFHQNLNKRRFIAKVRPPRLNGASCGVFASRAPHRPNPFGLTLAKIDAVKDGSLFISGIDMIDGTPILDIKPYIEKYDYPLQVDRSIWSKTDCVTETEPQPTIEDNNLVEPPPSSSSVPSNWVNGSVVSDIAVDFTPRSLKQLSAFHPKSFHQQSSAEPSSSSCKFCFRLFESDQEGKEAIVSLLQADPRSVYRRNKCVDRLYFFTIDAMHITAWFDIDAESTGLVEVVRVKPYAGGGGGNQAEHSQ